MDNNNLINEIAKNMANSILDILNEIYDEYNIDASLNNKSEKLKSENIKKQDEKSENITENITESIKDTKNLENIKDLNNQEINDIEVEEQPRLNIKDMFLKKLHDNEVEETYDKYLVESVMKRLNDILVNDKSDMYILHKRSKKYPASLEIDLLTDIKIKEKIYLIEKIRKQIKDNYDFSDVFINIIDIGNSEDTVTLMINLILD